MDNPSRHPGKQACILLLIVFIFGNCEDVSDWESNDYPAVFYYNSFESSKDTTNWQGYSTLEFKVDAPDKGGKQSVFISGGCIVPHAYLELEPVKESGSYILRCWGKNLSNGGDITLNRIGEYPNSIHIGVIDKDWKKYVSVDTLFCLVGEKLRLSLNAGLVGSSMLVDVLEIVKVENQ